MRFYRIPWPYRALFPEAVFRIKNPGNDIYLTFDDGPVPGVTERVISILERENVPATFFCNGANYENYERVADLYRSSILKVANHGYNHLSGWGSYGKVYVDNVTSGSEITRSLMFRPPYGQITVSQYHALKSRFKIIFWDLMLYDFDRTLSLEDMIGVLKNRVRPGSILLLHDNVNSRSPHLLKRLIDVSRDMGYNFSSLKED